MLPETTLFSPDEAGAELATFPASSVGDPECIEELSFKRLRLGPVVSAWADAYSGPGWLAASALELTWSLSIDCGMFLPLPSVLTFSDDRIWPSIAAKAVVVVECCIVPVMLLITF